LATGSRLSFLSVTQLTVVTMLRMMMSRHQDREVVMTLSPSAPLKLGAFVFALLWTAWMIWWSGSLDRVNIVMMSICGAAVGYFWYRGMRWYFRRMRLRLGDPR
jgi:hypothetical protein